MYPHAFEMLFYSFFDLPVTFCKIPLILYIFHYISFTPVMQYSCLFRPSYRFFPAAYTIFFLIFTHLHIVHTVTKRFTRQGADFSRDLPHQPDDPARSRNHHKPVSFYHSDHLHQIRSIDILLVLWEKHSGLFVVDHPFDKLCQIFYIKHGTLIMYNRK